MITLVLQLLYKANRILGLISKIFQYREPDMIIKLYKSLVRLIIEYGNHIWGPHYATDQTEYKGVPPSLFPSYLSRRTPIFKFTIPVFEG